MSSSSMGNAADQHLEQSRSEIAARDKISELNAANSPLLRLPAEIRNMIYEDVFHDQVLELRGTGFDLVEGEYDVIQTTAHVAQYLSLLRVSRQLYRETALLPYQLTTFKFGYFHYPRGKPLSALKIFMLNRSWVQVSSLQHMEYLVKFDGYYNMLVHEDQKKSGTGLYWFAYLNLEQSDLTVHGTVL